MAKRSNQEGTFTKRDDGRVMGRIQIDGKRYTEYGVTRSEAQEKISKLIARHKDGAQIKPTNYTIEQWSMLWLNDYLKLKVRPNSFLWKTSIVKNHIISELGSISLQKLTTMHVQRLIRKKLDSGLSASTVQKIRHTIHAIVEYAVETGILIKNCTNVVSVKKTRNPEVNPLSLEQLKLLLHEAKGHHLYPAILILSTTGIRRSELCGLKWADINWSQGTAYIQRAVVKLGGYGILINETKNHSSRRLIPLCNEVLDCLKQHRLRNFDTEYIFSRPDAQPIYPESIYDYIKRIGKKLGMPSVTVHTLRHTSATLLLESGENPKVVQELLGHASISTTLDIYSHVIPGMKQQAVTKLTELINGDGVKNGVKPTSHSLQTTKKTYKQNACKPYH